MEGTRELSNGVCIVTEAAIVKLIHALTGTSAIQLESSPYVTPNPNGTPIVVGEAAATYPLLTQADADAFLKPQTGFEGWGIRLSEDNTQVLLAPIHYQIQYENLMGAVNPNPDSYTAATPTITLFPPYRISGYDFLGWFDAISDGNRVTSIPQGSIGSITLYARWKAVMQCCTIACNIPAPITVQGGQKVMLPAAIPQRNNYCFLCWNTDCHCQGTSYLPGETIPSVDSDLCLYAIWERNPCCCPCAHPAAAASDF